MIWKDLLCCLAPSTLSQSDIIKHGGNKIDNRCVFCHVTPERFDIITETDEYIVFKDRSPAALHHLLAIPRSHTANIKSLHGTQGASLIKDLNKIGQAALKSVIRKGEENYDIKFGFHIPPFRSVDHLHLHCLVLPFGSILKATKYRVAKGDPKANPPTSKGWSWFVTASQAIEILERNSQIKVGAC